MTDLDLKDLAALPAVLRTLLDAELAAGNEIAEVGHSFPAPPAGAYIKLTKALQTRAPQSGEGLDYYDRKGSTYSGEITDSKRFYFLLEPPHPSEPEPEPSAIRAALEARSGSHSRVISTAEKSASESTLAARVPTAVARISPRPIVAPDHAGQTALQRFEASMVMDFDKWHDGTGYDLDALRAMTPEEKSQMEARLIRRGARDWRDIEALACFNSPAAYAAIKAEIKNSDPEIRNAVTRFAPELISDSSRVASLIQGLATGKFFYGLSQTLDLVAEFHPPLIVEALLRGALARDGEVAVHFAAMLYFIKGKATEPFDMEQRPFFLRFNTDDRAERETVFRELCENIGVEPIRYLGKTRK